MSKKNKAPQEIRAWEYEHDEGVIIPADLWLGLKWKGDNGEDYVSEISAYDYRNGKRIARLHITSYLGSIGAMHYYGNIEASCPSGVTTENGKRCAHGGYMGKNAPEMTRLSIQAQRRLTKVEKDMAGEVIGKIGDWTYRFNREADVLPAAVKTFKRKFGPGWVVVDDESKVICET